MFGSVPIFFGLAFAPWQGPVTSPYASKGLIEIRPVRPIQRLARPGEAVTIDVDLTATYDNPFDPRDVELNALVTTPSGRTYTMPGFLNRPYSRSLEAGKEVVTPTGPPGWQVRICPTEAGLYKMRITLRDRNGKAEANASFTATGAAGPGFVRVSQRDPRCFEDGGKAYFPLGANVCWGGPRGTFDYDDWWKSYALAGCNYARLWLSPPWSTFALERPGKPEEGHGPWLIDLANAWRLERTLDEAGRAGMRVMLCIDSYNVLRQVDGYPEWDANPWNVANGGPLRAPKDFWTSPIAARGYRNKLRYLVARYGAMTTVLAWELWNEVDLTTGFDASTVAQWHRNAAIDLRALDPYSHMITTSEGSTDGVKAIDGLAEIDFIQTHHYNSPDIAASVANAQIRKAEYGKPHFIGEVGADSSGPRADDDPEGMQVHDPLWTSIATGGSGGAMSWWWDSLIHPRNLYPLYAAAHRFIDGIDWPAEAFRQVWPKATYQVPPAQKERDDVVIENGAVSWGPSNVNRPTAIRISPTGVSAPLGVAGIQHGVANHPDCHNPLTITLTSPIPTRFEVEVGDVSGFGGAQLRAKLDGETMLDKAFPADAGDSTHKTLTRYSGTYGFDVAAGTHRIVVENTGQDWFMAAYRFRNLAVQTAPRIVAWEIVGSDVALAWCRVAERSWRRVHVTKTVITPASRSIVTMPGLAAGNWLAEVWDTWKGEIVESNLVKVGLDGQAKVRLPRMDRDFAIKLRRSS